MRQVPARRMDPGASGRSHGQRMVHLVAGPLFDPLQSRKNDLIGRSARLSAPLRLLNEGGVPAMAMVGGSDWGGNKQAVG